MSAGSAPPHLFELSCHPDTPCGAVSAIAAELRNAGPGFARIVFRVSGDIERIRLPPRAAQRDRLWQHTCFEVFFASEGSAAYHEFNFSPARDWAAYAFARYREGGLVEDSSLDPRIDVRFPAGGRMELEALLRMDRLGAQLPQSRLAVCAVIEDERGELSYWALRHPAGKPDFHHPDSFCSVPDEIWH